jgi:Flp pilus assembly protein TadB
MDPPPPPGRTVTATMVAIQAGLGTAVAVAAIGLGRPPDPLASSAIVRGRPPSIGNVLEVVGGWPILRGVRITRTTMARLDRSGADRSERQVVGSKALVAATTMLAVSAIASPVLGLATALLAWRVPDLALARLARRTLAAADREIPVLLDLLAVSTSAGLPPQLAFRRAVEAATGPLADELRSVLDASDLGGRWRDELIVVGDRLALPDLQRLLGALARTDSLGSSLAQEIGHLASDVREVRRAAAAQRARTAPVKMLFPLVFLVLPAFLLLTVVPVLLTTVRSID